MTEPRKYRKKPVVIDPSADQESVAYRIAAYVETHPDFGNWSPRRAAYEAVAVILSDKGAAADVLQQLEGKSARGLVVVREDDVPPWMERVQWQWTDEWPPRPVIDDDDGWDGWPEDPDARPLYVIKETET